MLSYMLPVEEKPPPIPNKNHLQLDLDQSEGVGGGRHHHQQTTRVQRSPRHVAHTCLSQPMTNGKVSSKAPTISSESSVSSISSSDVGGSSSTTSQNTATPTDRPKPKLVINGTKHAPLKRVSFGSSKGSMVETLIYESPLQEEPEASPILENCSPFSGDSEISESEPSKRVRVTFFESSKPLAVTSPDPSDLLDLLDAPVGSVMTSSSPVPDSAPPYDRQASTDSGWDNPFRPDGDLSREADEIVELIKGGKPITPTPGSVAPKLPFVTEAADSAPSSPTALTAPTVQQSPPQRKVVGANGAAPCTEEKQPLNSTPAPVEVKRETVVPASDASQVEHVVLKKKPKCKCCVIQ